MFEYKKNAQTLVFDELVQNTWQGGAQAREQILQALKENQTVTLDLRKSKGVSLDFAEATFGMLAFHLPELENWQSKRIHIKAASPFYDAFQESLRITKGKYPGREDVWSNLDKIRCILIDA